MSRPRVYFPADAPPGDRVTLPRDDAHRLRHVLRLSTGDAISLFDGRGHEWAGRVAAMSKHSVEVEGLAPITPVTESRVHVTLAIGILKGDQMDAVVRDATMLGVAAIVPLQTAHVTVPSKAWQSGQVLDRWQRVAIASATQCRRAVVPDVRPVTDLESCLRAPAEVRLICAEPAANAAGSEWSVRPAPASVQLLIGPEGGWAADEMRQALAAGAHVVSLGPRTLRAETAPVVALSLISAAWGW